MQATDYLRARQTSGNNADTSALEQRLLEKLRSGKLTIGNADLLARIQQSKGDYDSRNYASDNQLAASMYGADRGYDTARYTSDNSLKGNMYGADRGLDATRLTTNASMHNAGLGAMSSMYGADRSLDASRLGANASMHNAGLAAGASMYGADRGLDASRIGADTNLYVSDNQRAASMYGADRGLDASYASAGASMYGADRGLDASRLGALANMYGADRGVDSTRLNAGASMYNSDNQLAGVRHQSDNQTEASMYGSDAGLRSQALSAHNNYQTSRGFAPTNYGLGNSFQPGQITGRPRRSGLRAIDGFGGNSDQYSIESRYPDLYPPIQTSKPDASLDVRAADGFSWGNSNPLYKKAGEVTNIGADKVAANQYRVMKANEEDNQTAIARGSAPPLHMVNRGSFEMEHDFDENGYNKYTGVLDESRKNEGKYRRASPSFGARNGGEIHAAGGFFNAMARTVGLGKSDAEIETEIRAKMAEKEAKERARQEAANNAPNVRNGLDGMGGQSMARRERAAGLRDGGTLRTGMGGAVPGTGTGDKIPAKYEPGEFVVSNAMLDAEPELLPHLRQLRKEVLAEKGMTPEEADAKALNGGKAIKKMGAMPVPREKVQIRAEDAVLIETDEQKAKRLGIPVSDVVAIRLETEKKTARANELRAADAPPTEDQITEQKRQAQLKSGKEDSATRLARIERFPAIKQYTPPESSAPKGLFEGDPDNVQKPPVAKAATVSATAPTPDTKSEVKAKAETPASKEPAVVTAGDLTASDALVNSVLIPRGRADETAQTRMAALKAGAPLEGNGRVVGNQVLPLTAADSNLQAINSNKNVRDKLNEALDMRGAGIQVDQGENGPVFSNSPAAQKMRYTGTDGKPTNDWGQTKEYQEGLAVAAMNKRLANDVDARREAEARAYHEAGMAGNREIAQSEALKELAQQRKANDFVLSIRGEPDNSPRKLAALKSNEQLGAMEGQIRDRFVAGEAARDNTTDTNASNQQIHAADRMAKANEFAQTNQLAKDKFGIEKQANDLQMQDKQAVLEAQQAYKQAIASGDAKAIKLAGRTLAAITGKNTDGEWKALPGTKYTDENGVQHVTNPMMYHTGTGEDRQIGSGQQPTAQLPPKDKLVKGQIYQTRIGTAVWDGENFNAV